MYPDAEVQYTYNGVSMYFELLHKRNVASREDASTASLITGGDNSFFFVFAFFKARYSGRFEFIGF